MKQSTGSSAENVDTESCCLIPPNTASLSKSDKVVPLHFEWCQFMFTPSLWWSQNPKAINTSFRCTFLMTDDLLSKDRPWCRLQHEHQNSRVQLMPMPPTNLCLSYLAAKRHNSHSFWCYSLCEIWRLVSTRSNRLVWTNFEKAKRHQVKHEIFPQDLPATWASCAFWWRHLKLTHQIWFWPKSHR